MRRRFVVLCQHLHQLRIFQPFGNLQRRSSSAAYVHTCPSLAQRSDKVCIAGIHCIVQRGVPELARHIYGGAVGLA